MLLLLAAVACSDGSSVTSAGPGFCTTWEELLSRANDLGSPTQDTVEELRSILYRLELHAPNRVAEPTEELVDRYDRLLDTWEQANFELEAFLDLASRDVRETLQRLVALVEGESFQSSDPESSMVEYTKNHC